MLTKHFPAWFTQTSWFLCILCYCISFRKMVCYVFWTGSEYEIMCNFIVLILTCDWLISKFGLFFFLGGLGSCSHTVNALQIKTIGGGARGGHCLIFSWTGPSLRLKIHYWSSFGRKWKYVKMNRSFKIWGSVLSQLNTAVCHVMSSGFKVLLGSLTTQLFLLVGKIKQFLYWFMFWLAIQQDKMGLPCPLACFITAREKLSFG